MIVKTVGRGQENSIVINDDKVSRTHLQIVQDDNGNISVVDLGSSNGTYVNGRRIVSEARLKKGDEVRIGDTILHWENYLSPHPPQTHKTQSAVSNSAQQSKATLNKKWLYAAGAVVTLVIIGGIILLVRNAKEAERKQQELMAENEMYRNKSAELEKKQHEQGIFHDEYEKAVSEAFETQSAKEKKIIKDMADSLDKARKRSNAELERTKQQNDSRVREERKKAEKVKKEAQQKLEAANFEKDAAIKSANDKATEETAKARLSERKLQLTDTFYDALNKAKKDGTLNLICKVLLPDKKLKNEDDRYNAIKDEFKKRINASDTNTCNEIINIVKKPKQKLKKMEKEGDSPILNKTAKSGDKGGINPNDTITAKQK